VDDRLKQESSAHCDALVSLPKTMLTDCVASSGRRSSRALDQALRVALALG
jgi:mRNA interferase MazF